MPKADYKDRAIKELLEAFGMDIESGNQLVVNGQVLSRKTYPALARWVHREANRRSIAEDRDAFTRALFAAKECGVITFKQLADEYLGAGGSIADAKDVVLEYLARHLIRGLKCGFTTDDFLNHFLKYCKLDRASLLDRLREAQEELFWQHRERIQNLALAFDEMAVPLPANFEELARAFLASEPRGTHFDIRRAFRAVPEVRAYLDNLNAPYRDAIRDAPAASGTITTEVKENES